MISLIVFWRALRAQMPQILGWLQNVHCNLRGSPQPSHCQNPRILPHSRSCLLCSSNPRSTRKSAKSALRSLCRCNSSLCQLSSNWSDSSFCRFLSIVSREGSNSPISTVICSPFHNKKGSDGGAAVDQRCSISPLLVLCPVAFLSYY